jgi:hypothetical protein
MGMLSNNDQNVNTIHIFVILDLNTGFHDTLFGLSEFTSTSETTVLPTADSTLTLLVTC